jgi:hypothetical protein
MTAIRLIPAIEATKEICDEQYTYDRMVENPGMLYHFGLIEEGAHPVFALGGFTSDKIHFVIVPRKLYFLSLVERIRQMANDQFPNAYSQQIKAFIEKVLDADEEDDEGYYNFYIRANVQIRKTDYWSKKYYRYLNRSQTVPEENRKVRRHKKSKGSRGKD